MINRRTTVLTVISAILFAFCLPTVASAQWDRDRDYRRDRRDDDWRRDRRDDDWRNNRNGRNGNYDTRYLRDVAERVKDNARSLERNVDRLLDNSRVNGTRREDRINNEVKEFRQAADRFRSRVGDNGRDRNRGYQEAQYLMQAANQTERMLSRLRVDSRTYADWRQIKQDLRTIANAYGFRYDGNDDGYYRGGGYDPRDDRNRRRDRNGRDDDNWWRQLPGIINGRRP
ncbi:MAG TPA: hypothetical protein VK388_18835 [Pyrinomonadaceae bacterium]|nr:hypothetical protein [Pyrinomonadaceae bacterium]